MILSIPFRFGGDGTAQVVEQHSDEGIAQQIGVLILTRQGTRELVPGFGVHDPTWSDLDLVEVNAGLSIFGPPARVTRLASEWIDDHTERIVLEFAR